MVDGTEEPTVEPTVSTGVEPEGTPPEPVVPEPTPVDQFQGTPFAGKTPEEMAKMYADKEAFVQTQSNELGTLRNENAYHRSQQPQQQAQPKPDYEDMDQQFLTNPAKTTMDMMDQRFNQYGMQNQYQQAQMMAPMVEQQAQNTYPIFKSLDAPQKEEVRRYMMATTDPRSGLSPNFAMSAEAWNNAAWMVYGKSHPGGPRPAPVNPVAPVATETPQATKTRGEPSTLDNVPAKFRTMWSEMGMSPEQQEKMAKDILKEGEK